jgi:hypothetical protein
MTGDAFILLASVFRTDKFTNVIDGIIILINFLDKFIKSLFDSFEFVQDEELFGALVEILIQISN